MPGLAGIISLGSRRVDIDMLEIMLKSMAGSSGIARPFSIFQFAGGICGGIGEIHSTTGHQSSLQVFGDLFGSGDCSSEAQLRRLVDSSPDNRNDALRRLNGTFSGILMDQTSQSLSIFVDRFGLQRLYTLDKNGLFLFASEAKAILAVCPDARTLDLQGVGEWVSIGCVLKNRTLFRGISLLPPGGVQTFHGVDRKLETYFGQDEWTREPALATADYVPRLCEFFSSRIRDYVTPGVGVSLTGGLDGRLIMAWLGAGPGEAPCYTFNGPYRDCADVRIARKVARACRQEHHTIQLDSDFFEKFPKLAAECVFVSDGTMDVSGAAEIYANHFARSIAPIRLTGNYGSEILRGHVAFRPASTIPDVFNPEVRQACQQAAETYRSERQCDLRTFIAAKQLPWYHYARNSVERSRIKVRSPYIDNEFVQIAFRAPQNLYTSVEPSLEVIARGLPVLAGIPTDRGLTWPLQRTSGMRKRWHDFWAKAEYAFDYGMPDWLANFDSPFRRLRAERLFLGRQKFCHFRIWYRDRLADYVKQLLLDEQALSRPWWSRQRLTEVVQSHTNGVRNHTLLLHKVISLELTARKLLAANA